MPAQSGRSLRFAQTGIGLTYTLMDHVRSGAEFLFGDIDQWGNIGPTGTPTEDADLGRLAQSISGIGIAPNSDVPAVGLHYALPRVSVGEVAGPARANAAVAVGAPLRGGVVAGAVGGGVDGSDIVLSALLDDYNIVGDNYRDTRWGDTFYQEGQAAAQPFGVALGLDVFQPPMLRVYLATGGSKLEATFGQHRCMYTRSARITNVPFAGEAIIQVIPVMGRKYAAVTARNYGNTPVDMRISATQPGYRVGNLQTEVQMAPGAYPATLRLATNAHTRWQVPLDGDFDFLLVYGLSIGQALGTVRLTLCAYD